MINKKMYELGANPSVIRNLFEYGKKRKLEIGADNVFDFSIGNPSVPAPRVVNETLIKLINEKSSEELHGYTSAVGDMKVREEIASFLKNKYGVDESASLIYLTVGAAAALTISLNAILNEGDEVIVFSPYFPEYKVFVEGAKGKIVEVKTNENFKPDLELLSNKINKKTKAIIINYPNNPTGVVLNEKELSSLTNLLKEKEELYQHSIYLISDEPYRELVYGDVEVPFVTKYYHNTIVCYSFSKSISLPGERIGYILVGSSCENSKELYSAICGAGRSLGFICAPSLFQYLLPYCLGKTSDISIYKENRDILHSKLTSYGYDVIKPEGAFYIFMKALEDDAIKFCERAKKYELLLVPSDSFGCPGYVRISYCVSQEMIKRSLPSFEKLIKEYKEN